MPSRILRDGILESKRLGRLSEGAQLLYYKLLSIVDDFGRYEADPELLIIKAYPWTPSRYTEAQIWAFLFELKTAELLTISWGDEAGNYLCLTDPPRGHISRATRSAVLASGLCAECQSTELLEVDHIVPVSRGGRTVLNNLQPLCRTCNRRKGAFLNCRNNSRT